MTTPSPACRRSARAVAALTALMAGAMLRAQDRPAVDSLTPAHLATGVDAAKVHRLVIAFDREMDATVHALCGGGASFPRVLRTQWQDPRTFVLEVELAPDRAYALDLASAGSAGFRAKDGGALAPKPWRFTTAGEPLADGVAAAAATRLFAAIRDHYSYRDRLGIDWAELAHRHGEALRTAADGPALAQLAAEVLATAQDPHVTVRWQECLLPTFRRAGATNFDARGLAKVLPKLERIGRGALRGRTDDGIGYLFVPTFARESRDEFDAILQALRGLLDCKALVLDVRTNGGGDETLAQRLAAFFVDGEVTYARHRFRDPKAPACCAATANPTRSASPSRC
jgi:hypothetical protein